MNTPEDQRGSPSATEEVQLLFVRHENSIHTPSICTACIINPIACYAAHDRPRATFTQGVSRDGLHYHNDSEAGPLNVHA